MTKQSNEIRILHVEDDAGDAKLTKLFLKKKGYDNFKITPVLSAEQGLEMLGKEQFDVVISDYVMPGMNGMEFLEVLRRKGNNTPFIIFTGRGEEAVAMEAINKGANRYVKKDEKPSVLFDTLAGYIQELVEEKERAEENARRLKQLEEMNKRLQGVSNSLAVEMERRGKKTYIDTYSFLTEYLDFIILGVLLDKNEPISESEILEELQRKFGLMINPDSLGNLLNELEEKGILERAFLKERNSFVFKLEEGMEGLLRGPTFSREMLTRFLSLTEGFKKNG